MLASGSNCAVKPTRLRRAAYFRSLVPSYSALCRPAFTPAVRLSHRFLLWGFGAAPGFACIRRASFKPFWPLALVQQALPAIILAALRRSRGPALFPGPHPSLSLGAPFWPSGLTIRRSRPPTAAAELRALAFGAFTCPPHRSCRRLSPSPKHALLGRCSAALRGCACGGPGHTVLAWLWAAGYGHTLLMQSLFGAALSSTLPLTRQSS